MSLISVFGFFQDVVLGARSRTVTRQDPLPSALDAIFERRRALLIPDLSRIVSLSLCLPMSKLSKFEFRFELEDLGSLKKS